MNHSDRVLTVSQLNRQVRSWLEHEIGAVSVEGEISNLSKPASGHLYFTLKDSTAQLRCVYFRNHHLGAEINRLQNGQQVLVNGTLSLYEARGDYQLLVEYLQESGLGDLYRQFELLKTKLAAKGLFERHRKRSLPPFPQKIGLITSPSGAAIRDILTTLERRYPIAPIRVYPCEVQGKQAAKQIIQAIQQACQEKHCDVLIIARGGGSIEDLWAFNDEQLAYAIANSTVPIVTGIGHETDFTIADFVADFRAATPTAAAESVTPDQQELQSLILTLTSRLLFSVRRFKQHQQLLLNHQVEKITSPKHLVSRYWQSLDYLLGYLQQKMTQFFLEQQHTLQTTASRLIASNPVLLLQREQSRFQQNEQRLEQLIQMKIQHLKQQLSTFLATLHAVSPLATLDRGYAIATLNKKVIIDSEQVTIGDTLDIRFARGKVRSKILERKNECSPIQAH